MSGIIVPNKYKAPDWIQAAEPPGIEGQTWYDTANDTTKIYHSGSWETALVPVGVGGDMGFVMGSSNTTNIQRVAFPFDSGIAPLTGNLASSRTLPGGYNYGNQYGYCVAGTYSGAVTTVDRLTFPFDSGVAPQVGGVATASGWVGGCNSSTHGYSVYSASTNIDRITFPFDSGAGTVPGNLVAKNHPCCQNSSAYGYRHAESTIYRWQFPFDSGTGASVGTTAKLQDAAASCNSSSHGYTMGGDYASYVYRISFPWTSGAASHVGDLSRTVAYQPAGINSAVYGYCAAGSGSSTIIDRFAFPFDSGTAAAVGYLAYGDIGVAGCDNTDFVTLFA